MGRKKQETSVQKHRRIMKELTGVPSSCNSHAATLDKKQKHFVYITPEMRSALVDHVATLVAKIDDVIEATHGKPLKPFVRLDERLDRDRSRGGNYHSKWRTESRQTRVRDERGGGVSIALVNCWGPKSKPADIVKPSSFPEYAHYAAFGDVGATDLFPSFDVLLVHECSHAVQAAEHLHGMAFGKPHGMEFLTHYSNLRKQLGFVDTSKPQWCDLPEDQKTLVANSTKAVDLELLAMAANDPEEYKREKARRKMQARRAKEREAKLAAGEVVKRGRPAKVSPAKKRVRSITKPKTAKRH